MHEKPKAKRTAGVQSLNTLVFLGNFYKNLCEYSGHILLFLTAIIHLILSISNVSLDQVSAWLVLFVLRSLRLPSLCVVTLTWFTWSRPALPRLSYNLRVCAQTKTILSHLMKSCSDTVWRSSLSVSCFCPDFAILDSWLVLFLDLDLDCCAWTMSLSLTFVAELLPLVFNPGLLQCWCFVFRFFGFELLHWSFWKAVVFICVSWRMSSCFCLSLLALSSAKRTFSSLLAQLHILCTHCHQLHLHTNQFMSVSVQL